VVQQLQLSIDRITFFAPAVCVLLGLIRIWNVHIATIIRVETLQIGKPTIEAAETLISIASGNRKEKIMNTPEKSPINLAINSTGVPSLRGM
jgi:hypothetical protein